MIDMANEIGRINRKLKAASKRLISDNDPRAIGDMIKLANERQRLLDTKRHLSMSGQQQHQ